MIDISKAAALIVDNDAENEVTQVLQSVTTAGSGIWDMVIRFLISTFFVWIIVHFLYYRRCRRRSFYFTFMLISIAIYFLVFFMIYVLEDMKGKTGIGIGIGLFGIFSIMRYRTDTMPVREMTYLFSIICLSVINALGAPKGITFMIVPNVIVLLAMLLCEVLLMRRKLASKLIQYDRIELITPERRDDLIADLKKRTGLDIVNVTIGGIDFLRDMAIVKIEYHEPNADPTINSKTKITNREWQEV
ncbi:MAG: DUF4956 domain-containing protein [Muribaculaceae bacterium]|nr:DUF4956 domain-containing protein [Muribaculaceae bacterium]